MITYLREYFLTLTTFLTIKNNNMKDAFDDELQNYYDSLTETKECAMCGCDIDTDRIYCSYKCAMADER